MFQDNPLLAQLKQQLHAQTPRVEGTVKGTEKGFGFLESDGQKSYFIPPPQMKKVMHGDRITASIQTDKDREVAEPETLLEPFLSRFVGRIHRKEKDKRLFIIPDHPLLKDAIPCKPVKELERDFQAGDWVVAEMRRHPLKGDSGFSADITEFITDANDHFAPWWVTLSRGQLERSAPEMTGFEMLDEGLNRHDLTDLHFITIDSASTEDMDDALYIEENADGSLALTIAIADPTAYISVDSELDPIARKRAFTNYLPGFDIPMLPRELSDHICSLRPNQRRAALVCRVNIAIDGALSDNIEFMSAWIENKAKLAYNDVSDWLEKTGDWQPENQQIEQQLTLLQRMSERRTQWRSENALVFKDRPDYRFILDDGGDVVDICIEQRRSANRIVEEAMITANICAATTLSSRLGYGIFNVHAGFDPLKSEQLINLLKDNNIEFDSESLMTLAGFCQLRRYLDALPTQYLDSRMRRFQPYVEIATQPKPHFGLGLQAYATWTSPIRKYGDMVNHRLLKALITNQPSEQPQEEIVQQLMDRRRLNRIAEREISDWLYARFLQNKPGSAERFSAEIFDISRGGMRVRLLANGATAFIPAPFIHSVRDELVCSQDTGSVQIKGEPAYRVTDVINVTIEEVRLDTRSIIARPAV